MKYILLFLILSHSAYSFTLNPSTGKGFKKNKIDIYIANTDCSNAGFTTDEYVSMVKEAVNNYWNNVATSALELKVKGVTNIDITGDRFSDAIEKVPHNTILAGCNESASTSFDGSSEPSGLSSILGAAVMSCESSSCRGLFIINAHPTSLLSLRSRSDNIATIAHELGHAFGLGHSQYKHNLMYYSASNKNQKWLGLDDIDAVTYLYPHEGEIGGLIGSCGTISDNKEAHLKFFSSILFGFFICFCVIIGFLLIYKERKSLTGFKASE